MGMTRTSYLSRFLASFLTFSVLLQAAPPPVAAAPERTFLSLSTLESEALIPALAGAVFLGAGVDAHAFSETWHLIQRHGQELLLGLSLALPLAVVGRQAVAPQKLPRQMPLFSRLGEDEPLREERTMIAGILMSVLTEAIDKRDAAQQLVDKARKKVTNAQLGMLSSAQAYQDRVESLWNAVLTHDFHMEALQAELDAVAAPKTLAAKRLGEDDRIRFIQWMVLRLSRMQGISVRIDKSADHDTERLLDRLNDLNLEYFGARGAAAFAYWAVAIENMEALQRARLLEALAFYDSPPVPGRSAPERGRPFKFYTANTHVLEHSAAAVFYFLTTFHDGSPALREASLLYYSGMLFPRVVTQTLLRADQPVLQEWISHQSPGMLQPVQGVYLRFAVADQYNLTRSDTEAMEMYRLSREVHWIPRAFNGAGLLLPSLALLATVGLAGWMMNHGFAVSTPALSDPVMTSAMLPFAALFRRTRKHNLSSRFAAAA